MNAFLAIAFIAGASACPVNVCDDPSYKNPEPLQCKGSVIKGGGYCGCSDVCAKVLGETCFKNLDHSPDLCDSGLECRPSGEMLLFGWGSCQKVYKARNLLPLSSSQTTCERQRMVMMTSVVLGRKGVWIPRCDGQGLFVPHQCDNTGVCFCVDIHTGQVDLTTKVHGPTTC